MFEVKWLCVRNILNSMGLYSIEAEVHLKTGEIGIASAAVAIRGGKREKLVTAEIHKKISDYNSRIQILRGEVLNQEEWDEKLERYMTIWGADITLSLSLAFARAAALNMGESLTNYLQKLCHNTILNKRKKYLIPVFSGGVHNKGVPESIQQIMFEIDSKEFQVTVDEILEFYSDIERRIIDSGWLRGYSSSSGFMTENLTVEMQLDILTDTIQRSVYADHICIALDVAAEHLKSDGGYRFYGEQLTAEQMQKRLIRFTKNYPISYIEDPFDSLDRKYWLMIREELKDTCAIFADDFTATQTQYMDSEIADGIIIKMKQAGTLSETLRTIERTKTSSMMKCVSHRSYETEDNFMCDLGVAINAEYMKIGGPRRGDRVSKYNQLLRIFSAMS